MDGLYWLIDWLDEYVWLVGWLDECDWLFQVDEKQMLKAFIPPDSSGNRLDRCRRYHHPFLLIESSTQC